MLCDEFLRGAREAGHTADKIFLRDKTVHPCLGCEACAGNGGVCVQNDDMAAILDAMSAADVIVLASPVYFYSMNAQMKAVIDRTVARYTAIKDKEFYFIATAADTDKRALERTQGRRILCVCPDGVATATPEAVGDPRIRKSRSAAVPPERLSTVIMAINVYYWI